MSKGMVFHKDLVAHPEKWWRMSLVEQLANIGSEISRAIKWKDKNEEYYRFAFYRALELFSLTLADPKNRGARLKEVCRAKELLVDWFYGSKVYHSTDEQWQKYFDWFAYLANTKYRANRA